jgi:hypothetical protein
MIETMIEILIEIGENMMATVAMPTVVLGERV